MRIDVVHPASIPADAARRQDRALRHLALVIPRRREIRDFEGTKASTVTGITVLRVSKDCIPKRQDPAAGPRDTRIGLYDWAQGMFEPGPRQIVRIIEPKRVMLLVGIGLDK